MLQEDVHAVVSTPSLPFTSCKSATKGCDIYFHQAVVVARFQAYSEVHWRPPSKLGFASSKNCLILMLKLFEGLLPFGGLGAAPYTGPHNEVSKCGKANPRSNTAKHSVSLPPLVSGSLCLLWGFSPSSLNPFFGGSRNRMSTAQPLIHLFPLRNALIRSLHSRPNRLAMEMETAHNCIQQILFDLVESCFLSVIFRRKKAVNST